MNYATLLVTVDNVSQNQLHYCIFYATLSTELINKITKTKKLYKICSIDTKKLIMADYSDMDPPRKPIK